MKVKRLKQGGGAQSCLRFSYCVVFTAHLYVVVDDGAAIKVGRNTAFNTTDGNAGDIQRLHIGSVDWYLGGWKGVFEKQKCMSLPSRVSGLW